MRVHFQTGGEGYISGSLIHSDPTASPMLQVSAPGIGSSATSGYEQSSPAAYSSPDGPLTLRVLQTEQVPYVVEAGGGVSTNCSIAGGTYTSGEATSAGNIAFGRATSTTDLRMTSTTDLRMNCNSYNTPPVAWRHVLSAMLVTASDGNAYIVACDAAWRWSKCVGLRPGDTFNARRSRAGFKVQYPTDKGKTKEAEYTILRATSLR